EPTAAAAPHPRFVGGHLLEHHFSLSAADQSALEIALRLRDEAAAGVTIQVAAVGPKGCAQVLRQALSLGADRVRLVIWDGDTLAPDSAATALATTLGDGSAFDLVVGGSSGPDSQEGLLARLTAESLGLPYAGTAVQLAVRKTAEE